VETPLVVVVVVCSASSATSAKGVMARAGV